jgi:hypothetical protein
MTEENQDSDSLRREVTAALMSARRDAWRARCEKAEAELAAEREKVRRLERAATIAEANRESLETLRQQYRLVHGYWHDVRIESAKRQAEIIYLRSLVADQIGELGQEMQGDAPST